MRANGPRGRSPGNPSVSQGGPANPSVGQGGPRNPSVGHRVHRRAVPADPNHPPTSQCAGSKIACHDERINTIGESSLLNLPMISGQPGGGQVHPSSGPKIYPQHISSSRPGGALRRRRLCPPDQPDCARTDLAFAGHATPPSQKPKGVTGTGTGSSGPGQARAQRAPDVCMRPGAPKFCDSV